MKNTKLLTVLIVIMLSLAVVFVSCDKAGDETTSAPETDSTPSVTDAPTEPEEETTAAPDTAAPETTAADETTEAPHTHTFGAWNTVKAASCTEEGVAERVCSCGEKETQSVEKIAHRDGEWVIDKEATPTTDGSKHLECLFCKTTLKTEVIPSNPHTPGEWIVDKAVTCTEDGMRHRVCTKCGETTDTEKLPAKGHTEVIDKAKAVTCTTDGLTEGKHCSVCKAVLKAQERIAAQGHKETDWIIDKAATTSAAGSKHTECTVCKSTLKTEVIPMIEIPKTEYTVTVTDGTNAPLSGVSVVFTKNGSEVARATTDKSGKAVAKLENAEYEYELNGVDSYFVTYSVSALTVSAPAANVKLIPYATSPDFVYPAQESKEPANGEPGISAGVYTLSVGSYRIPVEKDKMRYVFFIPTEGARYRFYVDSDKVEIGYYGARFFVLNNNSGTMLEDGSMEIPVRLTSIGNTLVIGYKSTSAAVTECTVTIERYSDMELTLEEIEWIPYKPDKVLEPIETPEGYPVGIDLEVWTPFDAAATEIQVYFNEKDGFYHLESKDGPVLYVRVASKSSYQESLSTIVGTSNLGRYIYDENGGFVMKERYNEILMAYAAASDPTYSVYPLDDDLIYILKGLADIGWYDRNSPNYIFKMYQGEEVISMIVMPYNGWLFPCVYFK